MSTQIERLMKLMKALPKKDIPIGYKYFKERDFLMLKELVDSAIIKINNNLNSENPKEEYLNIDREQLDKLKLELDLYISYTELEEDLILEEDDCENEILY